MSASSFPSGPAIQEPVPSCEALSFGKPASGWRRTLFTVIFESNTPGGKIFDVALLLVIVASVLVVVLDSMHAIGDGDERRRAATRVRPA